MTTDKQNTPENEKQIDKNNPAPEKGNVEHNDEKMDADELKNVAGGSYPGGRRNDYFS